MEHTAVLKARLQARREQQAPLPHRDKHPLLTLLSLSPA